MNIGSDIPGSRDRDASALLTPEERALADRIVQAEPQREPSAALDARILAAARAGMATPAATPAQARRPRAHARRRWPVAVGVAATLVLAVGVAWQLRPVDDTYIQYSEAPRAAMPASAARPVGPQADESPAAGQTEAVAAMAVPAPKPAPPVAVERTQAALPHAQSAQAQPAQATAAQRPAATEAPLVFDQPSPMDTPAPPPPAPPPPPSAVEPPPPQAFKSVAPAPAPPKPAVAAPQAIPAPAPATAIANKAEERTQEPRARQQLGDAHMTHDASRAAKVSGSIEHNRVESAPAAADARSLDRIEVGGSRVEGFGDQPIDDQPPASADSPQVQKAWLQRVRELLAAGQHDVARDSLREYQRRYPKAPLPDDLRTLLAE